MVASLGGVGDKFRKTGTISLIGIYTTASADFHGTGVGDKTAGQPDQTLNSGTSVYYGYRRIKDANDEYAQVNPHDHIGGTAPTASDSTHGGTFSGTHFYRLSDWDGYAHFTGDRERPTSFALVTTDCDQGSNCCGTGTHTADSGQVMWSNGCNPESVSFTWSRPAAPENHPEYENYWGQIIYLRQCGATNCTGYPASSSLRDIQVGLNYDTTNYELTNVNTEGAQYSVTIISTWNDTDQLSGGTTQEHHSNPASFTTPTAPGCTNCGATANTPQEIYFQVGTCSDCTSMGTVYKFSGGTACPACGITDADLGTTTVYSVGATVFQNLTAGDCLYESTTAGAVCVRCSGGQLSGVDFVASTTSTSPCSGGTPYKLWEVSGGCLIGSYTCIGA